jgi:hypothetical protein
VIDEILIVNMGSADTPADFLDQGRSKNIDAIPGGALEKVETIEGGDFAQLVSNEVVCPGNQHSGLV